MTQRKGQGRVLVVCQTIKQTVKSFAHPATAEYFGQRLYSDKSFGKIFLTNNAFDAPDIRAPLRASCLSCFLDCVPTFRLAFTRR